MIELSEELCSGDKIFVCSTIWDTFDERNRLALIYKFYNLLNFNEQCTFFKMLGQKFNNKLILEHSQKLHDKVKSITLVDLSNITKVNRYLESDQRLQSFFNEMTRKTVKESDEKLVEKIFEQQLLESMKFVEKDVDSDTLIDSVEAALAKNNRKRRKVCENGHFIENPAKNRKYCPQCKSNLTEVSELHENDSDNDQIHTATESHVTPEEARAKYYLNLTNTYLDKTPIEIPLGAYSLNPNTRERIKKVLDKIKRDTQMMHYNNKIILKGNKIEKVTLVSDDHQRSFIHLTADGLPMKELIGIIKNCHTCCLCGENFDFLTEITKHKEESGHSSFYATYGVFLLNIGGFHLAQCMMRSYVKLVFSLDLSELCKSIMLDSPKGQFLIEKGTDFRKTLDVIRTSREAKLREICHPFVIWAKKKNIEISLDAFHLWFRNYVKSPSFKLCYEIEKTYGTSLLVLLSSMRANNPTYYKASKKVFAPLLHINFHTTYSILDIYSDYLDRKMEIEAPNLHKYLEVRTHPNKTGKPFSSEPLDERHEEFNKRGLQLQKVNTVEDFQESFQLADPIIMLRKKVFSESYNVKTDEDQIKAIPDYEPNIQLMQMAMRSKDYLNKPENVTKDTAMDGEKIEETYHNLISLAKSKRSENVLKVMQYNDFLVGFNNKKLDIFNKPNNKSMDLDTKIEILIASEESTEKVASLFQYWTELKQQSDYDAESFIESLIDNFIIKSLPY